MGGIVKRGPKGPSTIFTDKMIEKIISGIIECKSIYEICKEDGMPSVNTFYRELARNATLRALYEEAKATQQVALNEENYAIVRGQHTMFKEATMEEKKELIKYNQWQMARLQAKKFSEKTTSMIAGHDGGPLETVQTIDVRSLSDDARTALRFALLEAKRAAEEQMGVEDAGSEDEG
jgi:hypothetical protein